MRRLLPGNADPAGILVVVLATVLPVRRRPDVYNADFNGGGNPQSLRHSQ